MDNEKHWEKLVKSECPNCKSKSITAIVDGDEITFQCDDCDTSFDERKEEST